MPTAKFFWIMGMPWANSLSKVSRALCPGARTAVCVSISPLSVSTPVRTPCSVRKPRQQVSKRISPPASRISARRRGRIRSSLSEPTWGFASYRISGGPPAFTKVSRTKAALPSLSLTRVLSLPSEKVPAPPSPNWTLEAGSSLPLSQKRRMSSCLFSTGRPRSISRGL